MEAVSIRELHTRTGYYVRRAAKESVTITDRGEIIAIIQPANPASRFGKPFPKRNRSTLPVTDLDSGILISEERDGR